MKHSSLNKLSQSLFSSVLSALMLIIVCPTDAYTASASRSELPDFTELAKAAIPGVVTISTKMSQGTAIGPNQFVDPFGNDLFEFFFGRPRQGAPQAPREAPSRVAQGSGFIVSADGYVITNSHVISDAQEIRVKLNDGREYDGKLIGQDPNTDVAVVQIEAKNLPFLKLGNSANIEVGQWAIAIGNPLGLQESLTVGVVSAKGRANLDVADLEDFIQTDAAINRGNSGGPLLNYDGEVIGMNTAIASSTGGYMGIGFAIPSDMIRYVMDELIKTGTVTRGFLGVVLQPVDYDLAMVFGLTTVQGALVAEVQDGSPAEKAGLKRGDVILENNGRRVESVAALRNSISLTKPGETVTLTVLRDGKNLSLTAMVGSKPGTKESTPAPSNSVLGIKVTDLSPSEASRLGFPQGQQGVMITDVEPSSAAALAGLKKDAVILEVNRQKMTSADQFYKLINGVAQGSRILLLVHQGTFTGYVVLTTR